VVYIAEAHASDEWPVGKLTSVTTQPKNLAHRRWAERFRIFMRQLSDWDFLEWGVFLLRN
jgi:hypothetical protein